MIISDVYDVTFSINNIELLNKRIAGNFYFIYTEDMFSGFPVCKANFTTTYQFISETPIVDGSLIIVTIENKLYKTKETLRFRVSAVLIKGSENFCDITLEGYLDFYEFFRSANKYATYGLSSEVFSNVAKINNLNSEIDQTNDVQLWVPSEVNTGSWLNLVAKHGWCSTNSCMIWFIDRLRKLYYKDLGDLFYNNKENKTFEYGDQTPNDSKNKIYRYKSVTYGTNTGLENIKNNGYGGKNHRFDLLGYNIISENANKTRAVTEIVNVNKELSQGVTENMMEFDVGNFHSHYFLAEKQNKRIRSLFSTSAVLSCPYHAPMRLGEIVTLIPTTNGAENTRVKSLNCRYMISSLNVTITNFGINTEAILCTSGYNGTSKQSY